MNIERLAGLQQRVSEGCADAVKGYDLRCDDCGKVKPYSHAESARYFATGWPQCCGSTMKLTPVVPETGGAT